MKKAIITGVTGQDGSYLAELLISNGYAVYGCMRRNSDFTTRRIDHLFYHEQFYSVYLDVSDPVALSHVISEVKPELFFNLAAQSHVGVSFELPYYTSIADGVAVIVIIEALKKFAPNCKLYQAGTSELFGGLPGTAPQDILTRFEPRSPYAVAKQMAHQSIMNTRLAGDLQAVNGVLFNHESPRRGKTFVTKKITRFAAQYVSKKLNKGNELLRLGNMDALRDWGYAPDFVKIMYEKLTNFNGSDFLVGTGVTTSVRSFCRMAFKEVGIDIEFEGDGLNEIGYDSKTSQKVIVIDERYFRPLEVDVLQAGVDGNEYLLDSHGKTDISELIKNMIWYDLRYENYGHAEFENHFSSYWN
jgi:GDPmannose 4,6-dehydratase